MSALTNLFTSMANKIRSKTGTATTYTPAEMVSDGIDDVFDAGVASATTPITPDDDNPVAMSANTGYKPTKAGYAIESQPISLSQASDTERDTLYNGNIYRAENDGYAVKKIYNLTPSNSTATTFSKDKFYRPNADGYAIATFPTSITPNNANPPLLTTGSWYKIANYNGYAIQSQPASITPANDTIPSITSGTIYQAGGNGYAIQSYNSVQPLYDTDYDLAIGGIVKNTGSYVGKIVRSRGNATPSDNSPQYLSTGYYKVTDTGYLYKTQQAGGTIKTVTITNNGNNFNSNTTGTIDIKQYLPNDYTNLTLDNFVVEANTLSAAYVGATYTNATQLLTYDASTGILTRGRRCTRFSVGGNNYSAVFGYRIIIHYI